MWTLALWLACTANDDDPSDTSETPDPSADPVAPYDPLPLVDPFIATGGEGAEITGVSPGAAWPFGMTLVGPDTRNEFGSPNFYHFGGYWWNDTHIHGISHTHAHGMGVNDYGGIAFLPVDGWDDAFTGKVGRMARFTHDKEWASPGRYGVHLQGDAGDIVVDIAATMHGAHTKIDWPAGAEPVVLFDLGPSISGTSVDEAWAEWAPGQAHVDGYQLLVGSYSGRFGGLRTWFRATFDPAPIGGGAWDDPAAPTAEDTRAEGPASGFWLRFPEGTTRVDVRVALSYVDPDGAAANHAAELTDTWDERLAAVEGVWRDHLGNVRVRGGTAEQQEVFHTAMYHSSLMPRRFEDVDGRYRGLDQEVHTATHPYYTDLSLWDTFRTLHPWYILAWPEIQIDTVRSLITMTKDGGAIPRWPLGHGYTGGMVGTPATQVLAESWLKGLRDFDVQTGFDACLAAATGPVSAASRGGIERYVADGFVAIEDGSGSVSETLEYAWSDYALALWGEALGRPEADALFAQSENWRNVWDPASGFFTGRCADPANPVCKEDARDDAFYWPGVRNAWFQWMAHYVEGNAWHYVWYVPYDVDAMIDVQHGGDRQAFLDRMADYWYDGVFEEPNDKLPDDYYWHGNEPVMHYAFLGSLAGAPDITADAARWVMANRYFANEVGLDGNDDSGTLSAWYLLAATGFFPIAGTTEYAVASPIFERLEVDRPDGTTWVVRAPGTSDTVRYVTGLTIDGAPIDRAVVDHATLMSGDAVFTLSETPGSWAVTP